MHKAAILAVLAALAGCGDGQATQNGPTQDAPANGSSASDAPRTVGDNTLPAVPQGREIQILAYGDSLFAGYNLSRSEAYPAQLEAALRARGINARVINAGVSGDTTAAGLQRMDFVLNGLEQAPAMAIVEFGGNDLLRGLSPKLARENLDAILARFQRENIPTVIMGLQAPASAGPEYREQFNAIYSDLADKYDAKLVPSFLAPLLKDRTLVQSDQIHPTRDGVSAMVESTIDTVAPAAQQAATSK